MIEILLVQFEVSSSLCWNVLLLDWSWNYQGWTAHFYMSRQRWERSRNRRLATFFGSGFEFLGKTGSGFVMYGMVYIACV